MNRNLLYLIIGALAVVVVFIGYQLYQQRQSGGVVIRLDDSGMSIKGN